MVFKLSKSIPSGAKIIIESPSTLNWAPSASFNDYVFFSKLYSTVLMSGNTLTITVAEAISNSDDLELYVEDAFSTTASNNTLQFKIKTTFTCGGTEIILDDDTNPSGTQTLPTSHNLTLVTGAGATLGSASVTQSDKTAGQPSDYTFTFTTANDVGVAVTDEIWIKFPR